MTALPLIRARAQDALDPLTMAYDGRLNQLARDVLVLCDIAEAAEALVTESCRELDANGERCGKPAEFVLWGKLFKPEAFGPRCYDHAAEHVGHRALGDPAWATLDLRKVRAALSRLETSG